ncbi:MAG: luciferase family protein [Acidimicrobiales bacterium]
MRGLIRTAALIGALATIALGACSSGDDPVDGVATPEQSETVDDASPLEVALPVREGPRRETTGAVPHVQLDAEPDETVDAELRRRAFLLPGVQNLPSDRSLPGARGLAFSDDLELARPEVISGSREFAHIHPDGSLHVWLPVARAREVDETKWGEIHPWADRDGFWDGVVMIYTPETVDELDITIRLLVDAYNFVVGASLEPSDIG